jgi:hypothetical protein
VTTALEVTVTILGSGRRISYTTRFSLVSSLYVFSNALAVLVGVLIFAASKRNAQAADDLWGPVGVSIIAAGVTGLVLFGYVLVSDVTRNQIRILHEFGIRNFFDSNTSSIKGEYTDRFSRRTKSIDIMGMGLNTFRRDFIDELESWAKSGTVRLLVIDPDYPNSSDTYADQRDTEELDTPGTIRRHVAELLDKTRGLRQTYPSSFQIRKYRCLPSITMVRIDSDLFWAPYLMHRRSGSTPTMLVRRGGFLFDLLSNHFEMLWQDDNLSSPA